MKLKAFLVLALFTAGLTASLAVAHDAPPGKGNEQPSATSTGSAEHGKGGKHSCKGPSVVLKGSFVSGGSGSFAMEVKQANKHGRAFVGTQATLVYDAKTKFKRNGPAEIGDYVAGDWLNVRACKVQNQANAGSSSNSGASSLPQLLAKRVVGKPAKSEADNSESGSGSTSTGETSAGSTTTTSSP